MNNNENQNNFNNQYPQQPNGFNNQYQKQPSSFNNQYQQQPNGFNNPNQQQQNSFNNQYQQPNGFDNQQQNNFNNQYQQQPNGFNNQQQQNNFNNQYQQQPNNFNNNEFFENAKSSIFQTKQCEDFIDGQDIADNKVISVFSYIGILFLIPLIAGKKSRYARFHTNQGLLLFIAQFIVTSVYGIISAVIGAACTTTKYAFGVAYTTMNPVASIILTILSVLISVVSLAFMILGIYNVVKGRAVELPIIGRFRLIKTVPAQVPVNNMNNGFNPNVNQGMNNNFNSNNSMNNGFNPNVNQSMNNNFNPNNNINNGFNNNYNSSPVTPPKQGDFANTFNDNKNGNQ